MSKTVLVVDDSMMVRNQVRQAVTKAGFDVIEAGDGIVALERAREAKGLALIVLDVNMPRMNGLDFLEALRKEDAGRDVPVVILTTEAQPDLAARAKSLGAKGWIIKPFNAEVLGASIKRIVGAEHAA